MPSCRGSELETASRAIRDCAPALGGCATEVHTATVIRANTRADKRLLRWWLNGTSFNPRYDTNSMLRYGECTTRHSKYKRGSLIRHSSQFSKIQNNVLMHVRS